MGTRHVSQGRLLAVATGVIAMFVCGGVALATIPGSSGVISACYVKPGQAGAGQVRVIDAEAGKKCKATENALAWNQQGPPGPQGASGPAGPQGPKGDTGPQGPGAALGWEIQHSDDVTIPPNQSRDWYANCLYGEVPTGGGVTLAGDTAHVISSAPSYGDSVNGWYLRVQNDDWFHPITATGWVICVHQS